MAQKRFELQHTGRPFGPTETPIGWRGCSRHTTYNAARTALADSHAEMKQACGQDGWSDHFRIIPLLDTKMRVEFTCAGWIDWQNEWGSSQRFCENHADVTESYLWPANTPHNEALPEKPSAWPEANQCEVCFAREEASRSELEKRQVKIDGTARAVAVFDERGKLTNAKQVQGALEKIGVHWSDALDYAGQMKG